MNKMSGYIARKLYRLASVFLKMETGTVRNYWGVPEIDRLYEVEDFLRNIGEPERAAAVHQSRLMMKSLSSYCIELKEINHG